MIKGILGLIKIPDLNPSLLPASECLKDTVDRFLPYWHNSIKPDLEKEKNINCCSW